LLQLSGSLAAEEEKAVSSLDLEGPPKADLRQQEAFIQKVLTEWRKTAVRSISLTFFITTTRMREEERMMETGITKPKMSK